MEQSRRRLEDRLSELADYRKIHGHCNVPRNYSEKTLSWLIGSQTKGATAPRRKKIVYNASRIQELESLDLNGTVTAPPGRTV
jgi:hypothetical protein